jgi:nucleoid-associated protein YgaU
MGLFDFFKKGNKETTPSKAQQPTGQAKAQNVEQKRTQPQGQPANAATPQPKTQRDYVIQTGDSLSKIAKRFYGNSNDWQKI